MAVLSLKEKRRVEAVKIEGLCEKTKEVEQKNDVPGMCSYYCPRIVTFFCFFSARLSLVSSKG